MPEVCRAYWFPTSSLSSSASVCLLDFRLGARCGTVACAFAARGRCRGGANIWPWMMVVLGFSTEMAMIGKVLCDGSTNPAARAAEKEGVGGSNITAQHDQNLAGGGRGGREVVACGRFQGDSWHARARMEFCRALNTALHICRA
jgi:hypothetical protein